MPEKPFHCEHTDFGPETLSAAEKAAYNRREGEKWAEKKGHLVLTEGQYPSWANGSAKTFWEAVDKYDEKGKRWEQVEISLDHDLTEAERIQCAREFTAKFVPAGVPYEMSIHKKGDSGNENWHCHILYYARRDDGIERTPEQWFKRPAAPYRHRATKEMIYPPAENGGAPKFRDFNNREFITKTRQQYAEHFNDFAAKNGYDIWVDHRSYKERGIDLVPRKHRGKAVAQVTREVRQGMEPTNKLGIFITEENARITRENGEKIIADPGIAINFLTQHSSIFSDRDLQKFLLAQTAGPEQFNEAFSAVMASAELYPIGDKYTSVSLLQTEALMVHHAEEMAQQQGHEVDLEAAEQVAEKYGLSDDQKGAFEHILTSGDCVAVTGFAGSGKSYMLGALREVFEHEDYRVIGAALAGQAAESLEQAAGIKSSTIHALLYRLESGKATLSDRDILVIDEAGMVGTRQLAKLIESAKSAGAKVVLVGDAQQLQSIEAGGGFKAIVSRVGHYEMTDIRRQKYEWAQEATRLFGRGETRAALEKYAERGHIHFHENHEQALQAMVASWERQDRSKILLAFTKKDIADLNSLARKSYSDQLQGEDVELQTAAGKKSFAVGDRVLFLENEYRDLQVKNGTRGILEEVDQAGSMKVRLADEDRVVSFNVADYDKVDHGYASTIHKSQGGSWDDAIPLASLHWDQHSSYVAMTRHKESCELHVDRSEIKSTGALYNICSRQRQKDLAIDFALSRGIDLSEQQSAQIRKDALAQAQQFQQAVQAQAPPPVFQQPAAAAAPFDAQAWFDQQAQRHDISQEGLARGIQTGTFGTLLDATRLNQEQQQSVRDQAKATLLVKPENRADFEAQQAGQGQLAQHRQARVDSFREEKMQAHEEKWAWLKDKNQVAEKAHESRWGKEYIDQRELHQDLKKKQQVTSQQLTACKDDLAGRSLTEIGPRRQLKKSVKELEDQERVQAQQLTVCQRELEKMRGGTNIQGFTTRQKAQEEHEKKWISTQTEQIRHEEVRHQKENVQEIQGQAPGHHSQQHHQTEDRLPERVQQNHHQEAPAREEQQQPRRDESSQDRSR